MLNKKLLAIFSFVTILSSSNVFAKTEGNYFGVDLIPDPSLEKNLPIKIPIKKAQKLNCNKLAA